METPPPLHVSQRHHPPSNTPGATSTAVCASTQPRPHHLTHVIYEAATTHIPPLTALLLTAVSLLSPPAPPVRADNTLRGKRLTLSSSSRDAIAGIKYHPSHHPTLCATPRATPYKPQATTNRSAPTARHSSSPTPLPTAQRPRAHLTYTDLPGSVSSIGAPTHSTPTYRPDTHACFGSPHGTPSNPIYYHRSRCPRSQRHPLRRHLPHRLHTTPPTP